MDEQGNDNYNGSKFHTIARATGDGRGDGVWNYYYKYYNYNYNYYYHYHFYQHHQLSIVDGGGEEECSYYKQSNTLASS